MARTFVAGGTDKVTCAVDPAAVVNSVGLWVYSVNRTADRVMWAKISGGVGDDYLYLSAGASKYFYGCNWSTTAGSWSIPWPSASAWHHIGVSYDGSATGNNPLIYLDGVSQSVTTAATPAGTRSAAAKTLVIGSDNTTAFDGRLAEFAKWQRILTPTEFLALGKGRSPLFFPNGLTEYVPLIRDIRSWRNLTPVAVGTAYAEGPLITYPMSLPALAQN